jgi:hypothetical protein
MFSQISVGDDADQLSVTYYGNPTKTTFLHLEPRLDQEIIAGHRNWVFGHAITDKHGSLRLNSNQSRTDVKFCVDHCYWNWLLAFLT